MLSFVYGKISRLFCVLEVKANEKIDFYSGYEGKKEILIFSSDMELRIWDGYFSLIMEILFINI